MTDFIQKVVTVFISQSGFGLFLLFAFQFTLLDKSGTGLDNLNHQAAICSATFSAFREAL